MIKEKIKNITAKYDQKRFGKREFVIISNNCWGAEIYKRLNIRYNTPFVGLFLFAPDYIKLLQKFEYYMAQPVAFTDKSKWTNVPVKYPIGKLDDIEIHFVHYKDADEAKSKWNRRLSRMNEVKDRSKIYLKMCDRDLATPQLMEAFHSLPFGNKISFGIAALNSKDHIVIAENEDNISVPDGVILYRNSFKYVDLFKWIKTGKISANWYSKLKALARIA